MLQTGGISGPKLLQLIGRGTFGNVYRAARRGSLVAAKVIPMSRSDKFPNKDNITIALVCLLVKKLPGQSKELPVKGIFERFEGPPWSGHCI